MKKSFFLSIVALIMVACSNTEADINNAYLQGLEAGKCQGYNEGYTQGKDEGYDKGFADACKKVSKELSYIY